MSAIGIDCSRWQDPAKMPWAAWVAGGLQVAVVQIAHGQNPEPHAAEHLAGAVAAGVPHIGAYHYLMPGDGWGQAEKFIAALKPAHRFAALDVEQDGLTAHDVLDFCAVFVADETRPLVLYGNNQLAAIITGNPGLQRFGVWWASYLLGNTRIGSLAPRGRPHTPVGLRVVGWQYTGTGLLPPYAGNIDLTEWYEIPGEKPMSVPIITHGPKLGLHSIQPGNTLALVQQALDHGWHWPVIKILHDASVAVDVKGKSPETLTIVRYMPPDLDDEGLQNVDQWPQGTMVAWARRLIDLIFNRTSSRHLAAVDYFDVTNEPGAHGVAYYRALGLAFCELVKEADRRGVHLSLPALPQGVPEWDEMVALVETGLFGLMKAGGHIFDVHEGAFVDQSVDFGYGDLIPGAPHITPGAGSTSFRHRYLYEMLEARGEVVPLVISEFYGGGRYTNPPADQLARFAWYDTRARETPYVLAFLPFTVNSDAGWADADYGPTYASPELWSYIDREKNLPNNTGDDMPQPIYHARALIDLLLRDAAGQPATDPIAPQGLVKVGTLLHIYATGVTAGGFANRATVTSDGKSVWGVATALKRE